MTTIAGVKLTPREVLVIGYVVAYGQVEINNWDEIATATGASNKKVARDSWTAIKRKLVASSELSLSGDGTTTPAKGAAASKGTPVPKSTGRRTAARKTGGGKAAKGKAQLIAEGDADADDAEDGGDGEGEGDDEEDAAPPAKKQKTGKEKAATPRKRPAKKVKAEPLSDDEDSIRTFSKQTTNTATSGPSSAQSIYQKMLAVQTPGTIPPTDQTFPNSPLSTSGATAATNVVSANTINSSQPTAVQNDDDNAGYTTSRTTDPHPKPEPTNDVFSGFGMSEDNTSALPSDTNATTIPSDLYDGTAVHLEGSEAPVLEFNSSDYMQEGGAANYVELPEWDSEYA